MDTGLEALNMIAKLKNISDALCGNDNSSGCVTLDNIDNGRSFDHSLKYRISTGLADK